ncbi:hypothetical protein L1987_58165 [Smallanthus sonchifolius]|uniref:Uncharacterized protein n=1 Tax=Smallanthus sonchifolius TaxID=185202 RepID=A0ACB9DEK8_9ASTR|nr:hypothetical protein L1987_58165 [Smallanthus sonchifolius]
MAGRRSGHRGDRRGRRHIGRREESPSLNVEDDRAPSVERASSNDDRDEDFTFEPQVQAPLAREINGILKASLPAVLVDALKKANDGTVDNFGSGPAMDGESDE